MMLLDRPRVGRARRWPLAAPLALLVASACGGEVSFETATPASADGGAPDGSLPLTDLDGGSSPDAGEFPPLLLDASPAPTPDSGSLPVCTTADGGSLKGRVPANHRDAGAVCPARPSAGASADCGYDAGAVACLHDGDCTAGVNGRCLAVPFIPPPPACGAPVCSYDQCESDSDCPSSVPCDCRFDAEDVTPDVCATGSNCRIDSDCGLRGYCSPGAYDGFACSDPSYFCHTPSDTCIDDSDCCWPTGACLFDTTTLHFACRSPCVPPP